MQCYNMDHSLNIFNSESNLKTEIKKQELTNQLGLKGKTSNDKPLLLTILQQTLKNIPKGPMAAADPKPKAGNFLKQK